MALMSYHIIATFIMSSLGRLLYDSLPQNRAAAEPALNLALPSDKVNYASPLNPSDKDNMKHVLPCEMDSNNNKKKKNSDVKVGARFAWKYGPTILNMLPKGQTGNSGPSKGSNDIEN
ncbi:hypothetical protein GH714_008107 [Hevea brasiliensis]|uniref:Uncharacterized protein n=1 Tax=Hevea brasiliensis TaxID=3981 RepID=A0A6A6LWB7_HEVBR|nr:hypothetical protein GH714_008107 [Hevea brasiliensis]